MDRTRRRPRLLRAPAVMSRESRRRATVSNPVPNCGRFWPGGRNDAWNDSVAEGDSDTVWVRRGRTGEGALDFRAMAAAILASKERRQVPEPKRGGCSDGS